MIKTPWHFIIADFVIVIEWWCVIQHLEKSSLVKVFLLHLQVKSLNLINFLALRFKVILLEVVRKIYLKCWTFGNVASILYQNQTLFPKTFHCRKLLPMALLLTMDWWLLLQILWCICHLRFIDLIIFDNWCFALIIVSIQNIFDIKIWSRQWSRKVFIFSKAMRHQMMTHSVLLLQIAMLMLQQLLVLV